MSSFTTAILAAVLLLGPGGLAGGEAGPELEQVRALLREMDQREAGAEAAAEAVRLGAKDSGQLRLGRSSTPSVAYGQLGGTFQDQSSSGLGARRGTAAALGLMMRLEGGLAGGANYYLVLDVRHDPDDDDVIVPKLPVYGSLSSTGQVAFHRLRLGAKGKAYDLQAGYLELRSSDLTVAVGDPSRPSIFERDRYAENATAQATYEYLFQTGSQSRYVPVQYPWGVQGSFHPWEKGELLLFMTNVEGYYVAPAPVMRDAGGRFKWAAGLAPGDHVGLAGINRSNDTGEILSSGGSLNDPVFGLQNSSTLSALLDQHLLGLRVKGEAALNWNDLGAIGLHRQGLGVSAEVQRDQGWMELALQVQSMAPGFLPGNPVSVPAAVNAWDLGRYGADLLHSTTLGDPSKPMPNTSLLGVRAAFKPSFGLLSFNLKAGSQAEASSAKLRSSHFLGGNNATGAAWWTQLGGNYGPWAAPTTPAQAPSATNSRSRGQDLYNRSSFTGTAPLPDQSGKHAYAATPYRLLETGGWRDNSEQILLADPQTGRPLDPSVKHIAFASADWRLSLQEALGLERGFYLVLYQDQLSVSSEPAALPALEGGLFHQSVGQATAVLQAFENVHLLLNAGLEVWRSDAQPLRLVPYNSGLAPHPGRLEYHDRQAGVGLDWDAIPNQLALYARFKVYLHHDSAFEPNNFQSRQLWLEAKSFF